MRRDQLRFTEHLDVAGLLAMIALCWSIAFPYFEKVRNANETPRIVQAMAIVDEGSFAIDGRARRGMDLGPDIARHPISRRTYPNKPPGASVVGAAAYVAAKTSADVNDEALTVRSLTWWCRMFAGLFPTLLITWYASRRYTVDMGAPAFAVATMVYVCATPVTSYMRLFYGHQLAAALLFVGASMCLTARERWPNRSLGADRSTISKTAILQAMAFAAVGGMLAGFAISVEYMAVFAGLPLAVILVSRALQPGGVMLAGSSLAGACTAVAALAGYHDQAFGSPWSTGYHHVVDDGFAAKHAVGLLGLGAPSWDNFYTHVLSPGGGLLWWAPLVPLSLYGLAQLAMRSDPLRDEARMGLATFAIIALVGLGLSFDGGWRVGPRYLIVAMPFLILGWAHTFCQFRGERWFVGLVCSLLTYSLFVNTWAASLWPHFDLDAVNSPVVEVLLPLLRFQHAPYGLGRVLELEPEFEGWLVFGLPIVCTALTFARNVVFGVRMTAVLLISIGVGFLMVYSLPLLHSTHHRGEANLNYVRRVYEPKSLDKGRRRADGHSRRIMPIRSGSAGETRARAD